jgi:Holliday junction resolvasome RuvABC endonuclease subunit
MKYIPITKERILAIDPATRGLGYAVIEDESFQLLDWGIKTCSSTKRALCLKKAKELIEKYGPDAVVLENYKGDGSRRCRRVQSLIEKIRDLAEKRKIKVRTFSRNRIRETFSPYPATTKYEIARVISLVYPELEPRLPRYRKIWMSEDYRMNNFDAVALGITYLHSTKRK